MKCILKEMKKRRGRRKCQEKDEVYVPAVTQKTDTPSERIILSLIMCSSGNRQSGTTLFFFHFSHSLALPPPSNLISLLSLSFLLTIMQEEEEERVKERESGTRRLSKKEGIERR